MSNVLVRKLMSTIEEKKQNMYLSFNNKKQGKIAHLNRNRENYKVEYDKQKCDLKSQII